MDPVLLDFPFTGRWTVQNSPANRVPSHGTHLLGTTYAIDFVAVDGRGRSAPPSWRAVLGTEAPEGFTGFGVPVLAPVAGTVAAVHDGERDHETRRSPLALAGYALTQRERVRRGPAGIAGNHVVLAAGSGAALVYVLLAHLRRGSVAVAVGMRWSPGKYWANAAIPATAPSPMSMCRCATPWTGSGHAACRWRSVIRKRVHRGCPAMLRSSASASAGWPLRAGNRRRLMW